MKFRVKLKMSHNDMDVLCTNIQKVFYFKSALTGVNMDRCSLMELMQSVEVLYDLLHKLMNMYNPFKNRYSVSLNMNEAGCLMNDVLPIMESGFEYEAMLSRTICEEIAAQIDTQWTAFKGRINS